MWSSASLPALTALRVLSEWKLLGPWLDESLVLLFPSVVFRVGLLVTQRQWCMSSVTGSPPAMQNCCLLLICCHVLA